MVYMPFHRYHGIDAILRLFEGEIPEDRPPVLEVLEPFSDSPISIAGRSLER